LPSFPLQVTRFRCGGFALGLSISHLIADGLSAMEFIKSWSETARGMPLTTKPVLDRSILRSRQPPKIDFHFDQYAPAETSNVSNISNPFQGEQILTKCFLFDSNKLAILKSMAMEDGTIKSCSNFTALTAFVWRARCKALQMNPDQTTPLLLVVDVRSKLNPPLPKGYFGNGIVLITCPGRAGELIKNTLSFAVEEVQNGIKMVNEEFVRSWIDYLEVMGAKDFPLHSYFKVSSWTRLSIECSDFGWGEPAQFACTNLPKNSAFFLPDGKEKKGINLILDLPVTAMSTFQELMLL
jgi:omega-hydroxypalmitate O-feruloyl transferase